MTTGASDVSISLAVQDYTMAAGDQNTAMAIQNAYLTDASSTYPPMLVGGDSTLPITTSTDRPYAISLLSPTQLRLHPSPDGTYTLHWRKYSRPTVFTINTESFDCPDAFDANAGKQT